MNVMCLDRKKKQQVVVDLDLEGVMMIDLLRLMDDGHGGAVARMGDADLPVTKSWQNLGDILFKEVS